MLTCPLVKFTYFFGSFAIRFDFHGGLALGGCVTECGPVSNDMGAGFKAVALHYLCGLVIHARGGRAACGEDHIAGAEAGAT